jgi:histidinol-phosphatase (PHP family)
MALSPIDITTDGHVHTRLCHHARGEMEEYVQAAMAAGLKRIIFLEHHEAGINYFESTWLTEAEFAAYHAEGRRLSARYAGQIAIGCGVEVGANPECLQETVDFLARFAWDRIGLSYHYLRVGDEHVNMVSRRPESIALLEAIGVDKVAAAYFAGLTRALAVIPADVVCHLDAMLRHCPSFTFTDDHFALVREILALMRQKDMALEVNTSGFALRGEPYPALAILREAQRLGIRLVAGSDAHRPEQVGRYFDRLPGLLGS